MYDFSTFAIHGEIEITFTNDSSALSVVKFLYGEIAELLFKIGNVE